MISSFLSIHSEKRINDYDFAILIMQLKTVPSFDAKLSDICIGTSAAPTYLPPYYFENDGTEFNLVDGGVAATNPVN